MIIIKIKKQLRRKQKLFMTTKHRTNLSDIIRLIEWKDTPCNYTVFRNGVILIPEELDLYENYEVEILDARIDIDGIPQIIIYLI